VNAGAMTAQDADEDSFREKLALSELDEGGIRKKEQPEEDQDDEPGEAHEHGRSVKSSQMAVLNRSAS
jgi:hypothetical protein